MSRPFQKLVLALLVMAAVGLMTAVLEKEGVLSVTTAAWVQAVGSVAALGGIYWSTTAAVTRDRQKEAQGELRRAAMARHVSQQLVKAIEIAEATLAQPANSEHAFHIDNFDGIEFALKELDLVQLPTGTIAIAVLNLRRAVHFYRHAYSDALKLIEHEQPIPPSLRAELTKWQAACGAADEAILKDVDQMLQDYAAQYE